MYFKSSHRELNNLKSCKNDVYDGKTYDIVPYYHGTYLSQIHLFGFDVLFVFLIGFCLMLSPFLCVSHFNVVSCCSPLIFDAFPSVLVCYPDFVFCSWIYEFWTAVYYCCLYLLFRLFLIWCYSYIKVNKFIGR